METYEFIAIWHPSTEPPISGTRCLVTDGELVVFGTYVSDNNGIGHWIIPEFDSSHTFMVIGWMDSPKPMQKRVVYDDKNMGKN
jgi:hypothetical protein